jgi:hypothetical protein
MYMDALPIEAIPLEPYCLNNQYIESYEKNTLFTKLVHKV